MSSNKEITHRGRIVSITPELTTVDIISESACASCHARSLCSISESKSKSISVPTRGWDSFKLGDEVDVILKAGMGYKAVWLAYVVPLFILLAALLLLLKLGKSELVSGLVAVGAVAVYYFGIWLFRRRLQNEYIFNIKK